MTKAKTPAKTALHTAKAHIQLALECLAQVVITRVDGTADLAPTERTCATSAMAALMEARDYLTHHPTIEV